MTKANGNNETNKMLVSAGTYIESLSIDLRRIDLDLRNAKMYAESGGEIPVIKTYLKNALTGFHTLSGRIGGFFGCNTIQCTLKLTNAKKIMDRKPDATKKTDTSD